jgi:hypothetical protein
MCYRRKYNGIKARFPENIFGEINLSSKDLMFGYKCSVWLNPRFATQPKEHFILIFFGALPFPAQVLPFDGPCGMFGWQIYLGATEAIPDAASQEDALVNGNIERTTSA